MDKGKPIGDNVRLKIFRSHFTAVEEVDEKEGRTERAIVLEIGDKVSLVKEGDQILYKAYNIDEIKFNNENYIIIPEIDIKYIFSDES